MVATVSGWPQRLGDDGVAMQGVAVIAPMAKADAAVAVVTARSAAVTNAITGLAAAVVGLTAAPLPAAAVAMAASLAWAQSDSHGGRAGITAIGRCRNRNHGHHRPTIPWPLPLPQPPSPQRAWLLPPLKVRPAPPQAVVVPRHCKLILRRRPSPAS